MKRVNLAIVLLVSMLISFGCVGTKSTETQTKAAKPKAAAPAKTKTAKAPAGTPFSKIKMDMGSKQVTDLIGYPGDRRHFRTGKGYIPFYHGKDTGRWVYYYKGQGRVTFGGNDRVVEINYDPTEDGYK